VLLDCGFRKRQRTAMRTSFHPSKRKSLPIVQLGSHGSLGGGKCLLRGLKGGQQRCMSLEGEEAGPLGDSAWVRPVGSAVDVRARVAAMRRGVRCIFADICCCLINLG
jgi:hypothetical protein